MANLNDALNLAQEALERCYWDEEKQYYEHHFPRKEEEAFVYWWHAHTVDALLDGYLRTGDGVYMERIRKELTGTWNANHQTFLHNWYDDMEWIALALLRLWDVTENDACRDQVFTIWEDVKTAWNDHMGGAYSVQR